MQNQIEHQQFIQGIMQDPKVAFQMVIDMPKYMWSAAIDSFKREVINGNLKSRTEYFTYVLTSLGIGILGDKGIGKAGTIAKTVGQGVKKAKDLPTFISTPTPALAGAGQPHVPYNVLHGPLTQIKKVVEDRYGEKSSGKGTGNFVKVNNKTIINTGTAPKKGGETVLVMLYKNMEEEIQTFGGKLKADPTK